MISNNKFFQKLTDEDREIFGEPEELLIFPPETNDSLSTIKRQNWIDWRAAPYPAKRHSEYLYRPDIDSETDCPKILLSAVLNTPSSLDEYLQQFSRKRRYDIRGKKALARGYSAAIITPQEFSADIWEIIHSSMARQGRDIAPMFGDRPQDYDFPKYLNYQDPYYQDICCGIFSQENVLVAYLLGKRVGDHVQYDEIMGHFDHVENDVMYLLHFFFLEVCSQLANSPKFLNYGSWYSGQNPFSPDGGLNRWKRKTKFKPAYLILASS